MSRFPVAQNYFRPFFINQVILELENAILMFFQYFSLQQTLMMVRDSDTGLFKAPLN